jgi:hypothetical protein
LRRALAGLVGLALLLAAWGGVAAGQGKVRDGCLDCHRQLDDPRLSKPATGYAHDIHAARGFTCAACHGGDATDPEMTGMDPDKGFRGAPARRDIAELCAGCHASATIMKRYNPRPYIFSLDEFRTSVHCKRIEAGDPLVATCTNCHGVHGIRSPKDPESPVYPKNVPATCAGCHNAQYLKGRKVPTDQHAQYVGSVHGIALLEKGDLSAPACNDCHGNHGAAPPGVRDVSHVCGSCHGREAELFNASRVKDMMELQGKRACVTCHGNHGVQHPTDAMLAPGPQGVCSQCHQPGSPGEKAAEEIVTRFAGLASRIGSADSLMAVAETRGMESDPIRESLREARDHMTNVRSALHSFDRDKIAAVLADGERFADRGYQQAQGALRDWRNRRLGMAASLGVILVLIGLLLLKIRRMEGQAEAGPVTGGDSR